jgi:hypothetical protein
MTAFMRAMGVPMTRDKYIEMNWMGTKKGPLSAEEEAEMPEEFQRAQEPVAPWSAIEPTEAKK